MSNLQVSDDIKRAALENAIKNTASEIYALCLTVGVDPETIDTNDPEVSFPPNLTEADPFFHTYRRIATACSAHVMATEKLAKLGTQE